MKKIFGITLGGLQQKIFNLCVIFLLLMIGIYTAVAYFQSKGLGKTVEKANSDMQDTISTVSSDTMEEVARSFLVQSSEKEAKMMDDMFTGVCSDVKTLQTFAQQLFENSDIFAPREVSECGPDVHLYHEKDADPDHSQKLKLVTHMSEILTAMYENDETLDSCFVGTSDGMLLIINKDTDQEVTEFPVRERPWYIGAAEEGDVYFTDIETDAFTGSQGVVCSAPVYLDGELVAVVGVDVFLESVSEAVEDSAEQGGFLCIVNEDGKVIFSPNKTGSFAAKGSDEADDLRKSSNSGIADFVSDALAANTDIRSFEDNGIDYYAVGVPMESQGWTVISAVPKEVLGAATEQLLNSYDSVVDSTNSSVEKDIQGSMQMLLLITIGVLVLAVAASLLLAKKIVGPLNKMTKRMSELKEGDIQFRMEDSYRTGDEIELLAESFADLSEKTVRYIEQVTTVTAEKERLGAELDVATQIQGDMLPRIFPPYPDKKEFDIYATMDPAKEVGGDFYDFFLMDNDHLAVVMADVSGKGIPAALFMVIAKTIIKNRAQMGGTPGEIIRDVNEQLCEGNEAEMFVTAWLAVIDLNTGEGVSVNAGHEYPALKKSGKCFELVKKKHSPAVAIIEGMHFKENTFKLEPGDCLFVYTDGVPEATNAKNKMFGTERMLKLLDKNDGKSLEQLLAGVKAGVESFVGDAPQFDDMTMLALRYNGRSAPDHDKKDQK